MLYRLHDSIPDTGVIEVTESEAKHFNQEGWGIFWTRNSFNGPRRLSNLVQINYWYIDMDEGTKASQMARIQESPLIPSMVVETKRGYHVYWKATAATKENWNKIQVDRLVPFFKADPKARDVARILRAPGYYHMKDPNDPFLVKVIFESEYSYLEKEMLSIFKDMRVIEQRVKREFLYTAGGGQDLWDNIWKLDCLAALDKLSGSAHVGGEVFTFRRTSHGNHNIIVNGKGTSCWVDAEGRIGSLDGGGPTIAQWLRWYGHTWKETIQIIQQEFPQCRTSS